MTRFLYWRKMTWVILAWSAAMVGLVIVGGFALGLMVFAFGLIALTTLWFMTRPLWRRGHGARFRRLPRPDVPFKSVEGLSSSPR
jgi:hypothetical protein